MILPAPITVVLLVSAGIVAGSDYVLALVLLALALANELVRWGVNATGPSDGDS